MEQRKLSERYGRELTKEHTLRVSHHSFVRLDTVINMYHTRPGSLDLFAGSKHGNTKKAPSPHSDLYLSTIHPTSSWRSPYARMSSSSISPSLSRSGSTASSPSSSPPPQPTTPPPPRPFLPPAAVVVEAPKSTPPDTSPSSPRRSGSWRSSSVTCGRAACRRRRYRCRRRRHINYPHP